MAAEVPARHRCADGPLLSCRQLVVGYRGRALLPAIDFTLSCGELVAVVGRNGAGKTTWFRTLLGLIPAVSGGVEHSVTPLPMGYIAQQAALQSILPLLAWDVVAMGLERGRSFARPFLPRADKRYVSECLEQVGALELADTRFGELSEGQKQRVRVARLLAGRPRVAVLDEPTAAMDMIAEKRTLELVHGLCRSHSLAVLLVTHQLPAVSRIADRLVFVDRASQTVTQGTPREVFEHPVLQSIYQPVQNGFGPAEVTHGR